MSSAKREGWRGMELKSLSATEERGPFLKERCLVPAPSIRSNKEGMQTAKNGTPQQDPCQVYNVRTLVA